MFDMAQTEQAFSSFDDLMKFCSFFCGLGIGIRALLLTLTPSIYFRDLSGVCMALSLLFLSSSCELFRFVIDGSLILGIFSWLWFDTSLTLDFLSNEPLFSDGLKMLLLLRPNYRFSLLVSFLSESPLYLLIILGGNGTKLTHRCCSL
jgi:hypothetical protein